MRSGLIILLICISVFSQDVDSFITEKEYAQNLYKNPRGIGCNKCHGKNGEGIIISKYKHHGEEKVLKTKPITNLSFQKFNVVLHERRGVMPKYFLTSNEIKTLYNYLHKENR